ncbi:MAG: hypothetical protein KF838_10610 [Phycisphaeraceae bacterium]|nr:MAG: hypothetical protein KF838_10610 [Phycisphaeraceae bacterium]
MMTGYGVPREPDADSLGHIPCLACSYDLRGLASDSICPECTFPVHISRAEARRLPAAYLRALAICVWLTLAPPCTALCAFAVSLMNAAALPGLTYPILSTFSHLMPLSLIVWASGVVSLECVRSPSGAGADPQAPSRVRIAAVALMALGFSVGVLLLRYRPHLGALLPLPHAPGVNPAWLLVLVAAEGLIVSQMLTSLDLARRLESKRLRDSARALLLCSIPSSLVLIAPMQRVLDPYGGLLGSHLFAIGMAGCIACCIALFLVCFNTRGALNRLRTIRKKLIREHAPRPTT